MINKDKIEITRNNTEMRLIKYAKSEVNEIFKKLKTDENGISSEMANLREEAFGKNEITYKDKNTFFKRIFNSFINPFTIVLIVLSIISFITDYILPVKEEKSLVTVIIITAMVVISGILKFIQEGKSNKASENLKKMIKTEITVVRNGKEIELDMKQLVCGDIVVLSAGDIIPADIRLIKAKDLFISESSMTGESELVEKRAIIYKIDSKNAIDYKNLVFMGTNVISGAGTGVVVGIGNNTILGTMAESITKKRELTSFDKGVNSVSMILIKFMGIMVPVVFFINGITKGSFLEAFLFSISIAVGLTPEMLPMIVTTNLAKGAVKMSKKKTIVKNLNSIQNFGAMDVLCTDKTGTLTEDKIVLEKYLDIHGNEEFRTLKHGYLVSYFQTGLRSMIDKAIINCGESENLTELNIFYKKIDELPFDFNRRRMSVILKDKNSKIQLITKGAVEEILKICTLTEYKGRVVELNEKIKKEILKTADKLNNEGMRVIAIAQKNNISEEKEFTINDEREMVLIGYMAFMDPPKESSLDAIRSLKENGVDVKVLTGDNCKVCRYVCKKVGLNVKEILLGNDIEKLDDKELKEKVEKVNIFAKLTPKQKERIVGLLKENGHVVGFMGDGINDAQAMRKADIGISVDTAVSIAKESADIVLLEKNLLVLAKGVLEGRKTFANIIKYIKMTASSNFGNMFSVLVASAFLPFLPMLPAQLLVLNLIYDISCISIPWDRVDEEFLSKPQKWEADSIGTFMKWIGPTSSIFDILTYIIMYFIICPVIAGGSYGALGTNNELFAIAFTTGWFIESLCTQTLVIHMIRTEKIPFVESRASKTVVTFTSIGILVGIIMPYTVIGQSLSMIGLPVIYFVFLISIIIMYMILVTVMKKVYIKRYKRFI